MNYEITYESSKSKYFFTILYLDIVKPIKIINRADKNWEYIKKIEYIPILRIKVFKKFH